MFVSPPPDDRLKHRLPRTFGDNATVQRLDEGVRTFFSTKGGALGGAGERAQTMGHQYCVTRKWKINISIRADAAASLSCCFFVYCFLVRGLSFSSKYCLGGNWPDSSAAVRLHVLPNLKETARLQQENSSHLFGL